MWYYLYLDELSNTFEVKMKKYLFIIAALCVCLGSSVEAKSSTCSKTKSRHQKSCDIVGVYTFTATGFAGHTIWGNIAFHEGGTLTFMDSGDIGEDLSPVFPNGLATTVATGTWKQIGKRTYKIFTTAVFATKNPEDCCLSIPFARAKVEGTVSLAKNCRDLSFDIQASLWDLNDLTLEQNNIAPPQPIPAFGYKVGL